MLIFLLLFFAAMALFLLLAPVRVSVRVRAVGLNAWGSVSMEFLWGLFRMRAAAAFMFGAKKPLRAAAPKLFSRIRLRPKRKRRAAAAGKKAASPSPLLKALARGAAGAIRLEELTVASEIGFERDAALTALTAGVVFAFFSPLFAMLRARFPRARLTLQPTPRYNDARFDVGARCIMRTRLAHIIGASIKALLHYFKGALRQWHIPSRA